MNSYPVKRNFGERIHLSSKTYSMKGNSIKCNVCAHQCAISNNQKGICRVRKNINNEMVLSTYGRIIASSLDPIEKKPLRHFKSGSYVYTVATPGCTLACKFCQNWEIASMVDSINWESVPIISPEQVIQSAIDTKADGVGFSYTEPVTSLEFILEIMKLAHDVDLFNVWHTNGFLTPHVAKMVSKWLDAACVDLKATNDEAYQRISGGKLSPIIETLNIWKRENIWLEISTPILAGFNDDLKEIELFANLIIENVGPETPWHLLRGHPSWMMNDISITTGESLKQIRRVGKDAGLLRVYAYL